MSIQSTNLPQPSSVDERVRTGIRQSVQVQSAMILTEVADAENQPSTFRLSYEGVNRSVIDALAQHYEQHHAGSFVWYEPQGGAAHAVRYLSPPNINWTSAVAASATLELEEVLAHTHGAI